ncbi:ATP-binding protein [Kamptonema formosum]|uniref:ATP-binding protein n=1 Tax=Kamptonema formosum TaxID=331992 RepID=UPI00034C872A|nr:ATP-binding protein [Oscillatoria sp. PCC 10802]
MQPLTVPGTLDSLKAIANYVLAAADAAGLDKKASYNLRLAADEIATNIITYGYLEAGRSGAVDLRAEVGENTLTVTLEDTAEAFDPLLKYAQQKKMLQLPIEQQTIPGRGIILVVESVDKFLYERVGDRNRNIFVMNRPTDRPPASQTQSPERAP